MYAKPCYLNTSKSQYYIHKVKNLLSCSQPIFIEHLTTRPNTQQKKHAQIFILVFIFPWTYVLVLNNCASRMIAAAYINYKCRHISWQVFFPILQYIQLKTYEVRCFSGPEPNVECNNTTNRILFSIYRTKKCCVGDSLGIHWLLALLYLTACADRTCYDNVTVALAKWIYCAALSYKSI